MSALARCKRKYTDCLGGMASAIIAMGSLPCCFLVKWEARAREREREPLEADKQNMPSEVYSLAVRQ